MLADFNDTAVEEAKTSKRRWLWGSLTVALVAWLVFWWVLSRQLSVTLSNGTVIQYAGVHKGKRVSDAEFENDLYAYPREWVSPTPFTKRMYRLIESLFHPRGGMYTSDDVYDSAPELLLLHRSETLSSKNDFRVFLEDGLGSEQELSNGHSLTSRIRLNHAQLPMGSPTWKVKARDKNNQTLGELTLPNPLFKSTPRFVGNNPPLESRTSKGVLKLLTTNFSVDKEGESTGTRYVTFRFDASACPDLLSCHVIGVRVTDSWGNTGLIEGSLANDGKTIRAQWRNIDNAAMQSADWCICIAICRGRSSLFGSGDVVVFDHVPLSRSSHPPLSKRTIHGHELSLLGGYYNAISPQPDEWGIYKFDWELDQKGSLLWPVLIKAIGHTSEGAAIEIDPTKIPERLGRSDYWVTRQRFRLANSGHSWSLTNDVLFNAGLMIPSGLKDIDLHVALEEPQVFEFFAKISNWPTASVEKK